MEALEDGTNHAGQTFGRIVSQGEMLTRGRLTCLRELALFGTLSAISFLTTLGLTSFFHEIAGLPEVVAYPITLVIVFLVNLYGLNVVVFRPEQKNWRRRGARFFATTVGFRVIEYALFALLVEGVEVYYILVIVILNPLFAVAKFLFLRRFIFSDRS